MGLYYTKKHENVDDDGKTMIATEFVERLMAKQPEIVKKENKIESSK